MIAKIRYKKVYKNGKREIQIISFDNILKLKDLPREYLERSPKFYLKGETLNVVNSEDQIFTKFILEKLEIIDQNDFRELISIMKRAGARLAEINKKSWEDGKTHEVKI